MLHAADTHGDGIGTVYLHSVSAAVASDTPGQTTAKGFPVDQLDMWAVKGRVAIAIRGLREDLARLAAHSKELDDAMAEAERLGIANAPQPVTIGEVRS